MKKKIFNPGEWLAEPKKEVIQKPIQKTETTVNTVVSIDIDSYISAIQQKRN